MIIKCDHTGTNAKKMDILKYAKGKIKWTFNALFIPLVYYFFHFFFFFVTLEWHRGRSYIFYHLNFKIFVQSTKRERKK